MGDYTLVEILIAIIIIGAVIGITYIALREFGITIPPFVIRIFWIVVVAIVAILAIKFLVGVV